MVFVSLEFTGFLILAAVFMSWGVVGREVAAWYAANRIGFIAKVMEEIGGTYSLVKKVGVGITQDSFHIGELEFVKDEAKVSSRESWNRWGGNHPVLVYDIRDAKPMSNDTEGIKARPKATTYKRDPKPSSASTNLIFRRGGLKAMMEATKHTQMDPKLAVIVGLVIGAGILFMLTSFYHPGLVGAAPAGYYYKVLPIPGNATIVH